MPRIRTIKPQYWSTPEPPSRDARLLYIAMWNWADDEGVGTANPKELAAFAFPYDDDMDSRAVQALLTEISVSFECVFYSVGGRPYYCIQNFNDHQVINRPTPSRNPKPANAEKWLYQQEVCDHTQLSESSVSPHMPEVGSRKQEVGTTSGSVGSNRSVGNARESNDDRPQDRMGRPAMSLNTLAGTGGDERPDPPPPDRRVLPEARNLVQSVLAQEIPREIKFRCADAISTLMKEGAEEKDLTLTLERWSETDQNMHPGNLKFIYTKIVQEKLHPPTAKKDANILRTLSKKTNGSSHPLLAAVPERTALTDGR